MRTNIRLSDLQREADTPGSRLMNVKIPDTVSKAIDSVSQQLGCAKTATVIALLNEGLDAFEARRAEFAQLAPKTKRPRRGRPRKQ